MNITRLDHCYQIYTTFPTLYNGTIFVYGGTNFMEKEKRMVRDNTGLQKVGTVGTIGDGQTKI